MARSSACRGHETMAEPENSGSDEVVMNVDEVQYHYREYADNPLVFERVPPWLARAVETGAITPEFRSEDYWYLRVQTARGVLEIGPGDWIVRTADGQLSVRHAA